ncbi:hypothetical protein SNEBB_002861 [Seison nebaliae]|nr:hypothetical protein SNEBB_002861 [Seison nebaliae]
MSKRKISLPLPYENEVIRDPVETPCCLKNTANFCISISVLQIIMATPYLVKRLVDDSICTPNVCSILNKVNSTQDYNICRLPSNIQYTYLKHEIMLLMGLHKPNCLGNQPEFTYGCLKSSAGIDDLSFSIHNFFRILTFDFHNPFNAQRSKQRISLKKNGHSNLADKNLAVGRLHAVNPMAAPINTAKCMYDYQKNNELGWEFIESLGFVLHHLFLDPDNIGPNDISGVFFTKNETDEIFRGPSVLPTVKYVSTMIYYPHINFLHISLETKGIEEKFHVVDKTLPDYFDSLRTRLFNKRVLDNFGWVAEKSNKIIKDFDHPAVVVISEGSPDTKAYAVEISKYFHRNLKNNFRIIRGLIANNDLVTDEDVNNKLPRIEAKHFSFSFYPEKQSNDFWCGDQPCTQKLFDGFSNKSSNVNYQVFAFHLVLMSRTFQVTDFHEIDNQYMPPGWKNRMEFRKKELTERYKLDENGLTELQSKLMQNKIDELVSDITKYELYANIDLFNERRLNKTDFFYKKRIEDRISHSISVVKIFGSGKWFVISNEEVVPANNLREILGTQLYDDTFNMMVLESVWQQQELYENNIENLKHLIQPILTNHLFKKNTCSTEKKKRLD